MRLAKAAMKVQYIVQHLRQHLLTRHFAVSTPGRYNASPNDEQHVAQNLSRLVNLEPGNGQLG